MTPTAMFAGDPGLRSGWATWDGERIEAGILDPMDYCEHLSHWAGAQAGEDSPLIVLETYTITSATLEKSRQEWSLELNGAAKWIAHDHGIPVQMQKPAQAKRFCSDQRLRDLGIWVPGSEDHARDALRHLVLALAKCRLIRITP